jgi:hypothetical protein
MHDLVMAQVLGGALQGQQRVSVNWPAEAGPYTGSGDMTLGASINVGITNLNTEITAALGRLAKDADGNYINGEKVTVVGLSAGSLVVNDVLRGLAANPDAPDKSQITFIVVADSSRQKLIKEAKYNSRYDYTYQPAPETEYDIIVVTGEYDGLADMPDRWWNFLAIANAMVGAAFVHIPVMFADLDLVPAENITVDVNSKGGTTTSYLVPTAKLPLVQLLPFLASQEASLKASIDRGYSRNDVVNTSAISTLAAAAPAVTEEVAPAAEVPAEPAAVETEVTDAVTEPADEVTEAAPAKDDDVVVEDDAVKDDTEANDAAAVEDEESVKDDDADAEAAADEADAAEAKEDKDSEASNDSDASDDSPSNDAGSSDSSDSSE